MSFYVIDIGNIITGNGTIIADRAFVITDIEYVFLNKGIIIMEIGNFIIDKVHELFLRSCCILNVLLQTKSFWHGMLMVSRTQKLIIEISHLR